MSRGPRRRDPELWRPALERYWNGLGLEVPLEHFWADPERQRPSTLCYVERDGRYLMLRRRKEPFVGFWTAPGGKLEPGETPEEAICREIGEETGLVLASLELRLITSERGPHPAYNWLLFIFHGTALPGPVRAGDEGELRWFARDELEKAAVPDVDRRLFGLLFDGSGGSPGLARVEYDEAGSVQSLRVELAPGRRTLPPGEKQG